MKLPIPLLISTVTIRDVRIRNGRMDRIELSNGKQLGGIVSGIMKVSPDGKMKLMLEIDAQPTINGQDARLVLDATRLVDRAGAPIFKAPPAERVESIHALKSDDATLCGAPHPGAAWDLAKVSCAACLELAKSEAG